MPTTTIKFQDASFAANDLPIEVWMLEVANHIQRCGDVAKWLGELQEEWRLQATAGFGFGPTPNLERFLTDAARQELLAEVFLQSLKRIANRSGEYAPSEMEASNIGGASSTYSKALPKEQVLEGR